MSYTRDEVLAALQNPVRQWMFRYPILDENGAVQFDALVSDCAVTDSALADIKRTATVTMSKSDADQIDFAKWRIQPISLLLMPDGGYWERRWGVFLMSSPQQSYGANQPEQRSIEAYDLGKVLRDDMTADRYVVHKGDSYIDAVQSLLTSAGLGTGALEGNNATLLSDAEYPPGTSKYVIINDLLTQINYSSLSFDDNGIPVSTAYLSPSDAPSIYNYHVGENGMVLGDTGITETLDIGSVPNVFVLFVSSPEELEGNPLVMRSTYTNDSPSSPVSTVSIGRNIVQYEEVSGIADQATLDAAVRATAERASQVYSKVTFGSSMMPIHTSADVMYVDWGAGPTKYRETKWSAQLAVGGVMSHEVRRIVTV